MATTGAGSDAFAKAGVGAMVQAERLHERVVESAERGYERVKGDLGKAAYGAAVTTGGAVLLSVSTYVAHKTYYYFRPTPEMREEREQRKAEVQRKTEEDRARTEVAKEESSKVKARTAFRECLDSNSDSCTLTSEGYPEECRPQARKLSIHKDGDSEVTKMALSFAKHSKWDKEEEKDKKDKKDKK